MKSNIITMAFALISFAVSAQLKVHSSGAVGLGTTSPNTGYTVTIDHDNANINGEGGILMRSPGHALRIGEYTNMGVIGSSNDKLAFYYTATQAGFNNVYAQSFNVVSDKKIKSNIKSLENGLDVIMQLRSVTYNLKEDLKKNRQKRILGFVSQEVQEILPELTSKSMDVLCLDYIQIIPLLVSGIQEQQKIIQKNDKKYELLNQKLEKLSLELKQYKKESKFDKQFISTAILYQNTPNPFSEETIIKVELPKKYTDASILIFNMNGKLLKSYSLNNKSEITIKAGQFEKGIYLYSLVIDDKEIDTKRMILKK